MGWFSRIFGRRKAEESAATTAAPPSQRTSPAGPPNRWTERMVKGGTKAPAVSPAPQGYSASGRDLGRSEDNPLLDYADDHQLDLWRDEGYVSVLSSWLAALKWKPNDGSKDKLANLPRTTLGALFIKKRTGRTMVYGNVPLDVFDDFLVADSHGEFYNRYVRNVYEYLGEV